MPLKSWQRFGNISQYFLKGGWERREPFVLNLL